MSWLKQKKWCRVKQKEIVMKIRVAINGYGRIGRQILRAVFEHGMENEIDIVAINGSGSVALNAHLTQFDTVHGRFPAVVTCDETSLSVNDYRIPYFSKRNPAELPWAALNVDLVMECTGAFTSKEKCQAHLGAGAKKVLISAPGSDDVDATIVYGVNHHCLTPNMTVVSNASCTTNCLAPVVKVLNEHLGVEKGVMTTIHSFTNDQVLTDVGHPDLRRARAATENMIPTKTGAARAVGLVLPELAGKLDGLAVRVPTINVSLIDFTFVATRNTSADEVNAMLQNAAQNEMKGVLSVNTLPLVSSDFNHTREASIFDATLTKVLHGNLVKVLAWYDNEWGFSCQMLNTARAMFSE